MTITAKCILKSSHSGCPDITTLQVRYPRFIHAECKTHRAFRFGEIMEDISLMADPDLSRNASSSRAIPIEKLIDEALNDPAIPVAFGRNCPGMQAFEEIDHPDQALSLWLEARDDAVDHALRAIDLGLHKQVANRLLEPFTHISVVITATDWDNFYRLRRHEAADPTMRAIADAMYEAQDAAPAVSLQAGRWHKPYGGEDPMVSVGRCARVSYLNHDGTEPDPEKDWDLADRLMHHKHWSPFEHQAKPALGERHANLTGWKSFRTYLGA